MSRGFSLRHDLLDQQIVDCERVPLGRVTDVELGPADPRGSCPITSVLTGSEALGQRLGGRLGRWIEHSSGRARARSDAAGPTRLDPAAIDELEPEVKLHAHLRDLEDIAGLERWLAKNFIARIPGAGDARH